MNRNYLAAGVMFIAFGAVLIVGKLFAFDAIMAFVARTLSRDQVITAAGEVLFTRYWYATTAVALLLGGLLSVCSIDTVRGALV